MTLKTRLVTVTTTPTVLASDTVAVNSTAAMFLGGAHITDTVPILLCSTNTQPVYLGGSSMTTASSAEGIPFVGIAAGAYFTYNLIASDPLFANTSNGEVTIRVQAGRQTA